MIYDFHCRSCGKTEEHICRSEERDAPRSCEHCGGSLERQFPITALKSYRQFEPYYDESLGADVTSKREKKRIMSTLGVIEAGDASGGARNFDRHAPHHIKPLPVQGVPFVPPEQRDALSGAQWQVAAEKKDGTVVPIAVDQAKTL